MTRYTKTMMEALSEVRYNSYKLQEATIDLRDHDMTDPDFQKLIKKVKLKAKELKGDDGTTVTGSAKDIEKMLSTMYGNDWKDMYKQKGQKFIELEQVEMEEELDELKMNDPKLVRKFDKLKKGDTVKLKTSSTISKGTDFVDYVVKAKNTVNKGRVEKITLVTKGNEKAVKKFLYKRDGKVTFAIGDMGASIDDIKEEVELQEKVDKKLALKILSMNKNQKFVKVSGDFVPEIYLSGMDRDALKKEFGRLPRGLPNASNGVPVVDFINYALGLDNQIDTEDGDKPQPKLYDYRTGKVVGKPKTVGDAAKMAGLRLEEVELEEKLGKNADAGDYIDDFKKSDAPQFKGKSDKKKRDMAIAAYLDAKDKKEEVELDEAKYDLYHKDFSSAMQHAYAMAKKLHGITIDPKEIDNKVATGPRKPGTGKTNTYRLKGDKGNIQIQVYNKGGSKPFELNMYKEEVELEEDEKKPDKPDSAKAVDQARDDKKKTRIAQLQLQIAKASEMINKLNSQEKPDA